MHILDITPVWKSHPLYAAGKIELVPMEWLWKYRGADFSPGVTLRDGTEGSLDALWSEILDDGLHDPLIMRVGVKNNMMRLEAGNHRIQLFKKHGITMAPVTVQMRDECGPHLGDVMTDASHNFDASEELKVSTITEEYMRPSEVFKTLENIQRLFIQENRDRSRELQREGNANSPKR